MSKKALIILGLMAFAVVIYAQTEVTLLATQDFEGAWIPAGWTQNPPYTDANDWHQQAFPGAAGTQSAYCSFELDNDDTLFTPVFDCSGDTYDSVIVDFDEDYMLDLSYGADEAKIYVSTDGGASWNLAYSYGRTEYLDYHRRLNIVGITGTSSTCMVAFHYDCDYDYHWAIDNVTIYGYEPVPEPSAPGFTYTCTPTLPSGTTDYTFAVTISDITGVDPATAYFCYSINGGAETCDLLTYITGDPDGTGDYEYNLGGLADWDVIDYYFIATDTYAPATAGTSSTCQTAIEGLYYVYEDGTGFPMSPDPTWVDHTTGGAEYVVMEDDDMYGYFEPLAFPITYWGVPCETLWVACNGWMSLSASDPGGGAYWTPDPIPSASLPNALLAWFWTDLDGGNGGSEFWKTEDPGGEWTMITYLNWQLFPSSTPFSVQIQIWEPSAIPTPGDNSVIDVRWNTLPTDLSGGTIGIENFDGSNGLAYWEGGAVGDPDYLGLTSPTRTIRFCTVPPPSGDIYGLVDLVGRADDSGAEVGVVGYPSYIDTTDASGYYHIYNVPPGAWDVYCWHPVFYPETVYSVIVIDGDSTEVNFTLDPVPIGYIRGYADLTDTPPLGDAGINIGEVSTGLSTTTDGAGYFFFDGITAGNVQITATYPAYFMDYTMVLTLAVGETLDIDTLFLDPADYWYEDFESDDGGGVAGGGTMWEWGSPTYGPSAAYSGVNCWATLLDGEYDVTYAGIYTLDVPVPSFTPAPGDSFKYWQWIETEEYSGLMQDGGNIQISSDGGGSWTPITDPVPPYTDIIDDTWGNPMGTEWGYGRTLTSWHLVSVDLSAFPVVTDIRLRFGTDGWYSDDAGWYVDDMQIGDVPRYVGALEGYVYNCNTYATIGGATVYADGFTTVSDPSGYFFIDSIPYGTIDLAAVLEGYFPGYTFDITVFIGDTVMALVCMEPMNFDSINGQLAYGEDDSVYFEICNPTDDTIWFNWAALPYDLSDYLVRDGGVVTDGIDHHPSDQNATSIIPVGAIKDPSSSTRALGDLWRSYDVSAYHGTAWGLGISPTQFWVSDAGVYLYDHVYTNPAGTHLGFYDVTGIGGSVWMGDLCYDSNHDYFWQVAVGGSNLIYAFDPVTGALVDSLPDPAMAWAWTSARGVGYDAERDVFYIGGWNYYLLYGYDVVYEVAGLTWPNPGVTMGYVTADYCAGVAWHPYRETIFYVDALMSVIYEVDPATDVVISTIPAPPSAGEISGLEIDEFGQIWTVDQTNNVVYVLEGPIVGMFVDPDTFIAPGECFTFALINPAWETPVGDYCFDINYMYTDGNYEIFGVMPTCVQVQPRAYKGWELITVPIMATPNDPAIQFADDIVPFNVDPSTSNLYGYNQDAGILELPGGFVRGKGYYLKTWLDYTYWDVYGDAYPAGDFTYTMYYPEDSPNWGWWLVGNPFNRRVDWDAVYAFNPFTYMEPEYWIWSEQDGWTWYSPIVGGGGEDQYIDPWRGYFVYVRSGCPTTWVNLTYPEDGTMETFLAKKSGVAKGAKVKTANPAEFALRMSVSAIDDGDMRLDKYNFISVNEEATDELDIYDIREPNVPMPTGGINAFFAEGGLRYAMSTRQNFSDITKSWTFKVQDLPAGMDVTISWPRDRVPTPEDASIGVDNMDERWTLTLVDNATGETIDMREVYSYEFTSTTSPRVFTIILGDDVLGIDNQELPDEYSLGANVPNPFNATTSFEVALPNDSDVKIEVFDMLGRKVNTLVDGEMKGGYHRIIWDGVDKAGREVASGIYLYRVQAGDFNETKKMTLIK